MYRANLYAYLFNTASSVIPYLWLTKFQTFNNTEEVITIRSFLLLSITLLIGGMPTSYAIHQKNLSSENLFKICICIFGIVLGVYLINIIFDFKKFDYITHISIFTLISLGAYELSFGFFKAILKIKINLIASIIRIFSTCIILTLFALRIINLESASNIFLICISGGCILPICFYFYRSKSISSSIKTITKSKKLFKSSLPHYINIFCQSLVTNIYRLI